MEQFDSSTIELWNSKSKLVSKKTKESSKKRLIKESEIRVAYDIELISKPTNMPMYDSLIVERLIFTECKRRWAMYTELVGMSGWSIDETKNDPLRDRVIQELFEFHERPNMKKLLSIYNAHRARSGKRIPFVEYLIDLNKIHNQLTKINVHIIIDKYMQTNPSSQININLTNSHE
jgi:hypothetical protein